MLLTPVSLAQERKKEDILPRMLKQVLEYTPNKLCKGPFKIYETPTEEGRVFSFFATLMLSYPIFPKILLTQKSRNT